MQISEPQAHEGAFRLSCRILNITETRAPVPTEPPSRVRHLSRCFPHVHSFPSPLGPISPHLLSSDMTNTHVTRCADEMTVFSRMSSMKVPCGGRLPLELFHSISREDEACRNPQTVSKACHLDLDSPAAIQHTVCVATVRVPQKSEQELYV